MRQAVLSSISIVVRLYSYLYHPLFPPFTSKLKERFKGKTLEDNMFMGRALVSATCRTQMNAELRRKNAPDINIPDEMEYLVWFDVYEVLENDSF
jgi:hypothetical protein